MLYFLLFVMKSTYNPSKLRRARKFGFRKRNQTSAGRKVLQNRRRKGRAKLTASVLPRFR
jgi:large subunit ribosomal protein L34